LRKITPLKLFEEDYSSETFEGIISSEFLSFESNLLFLGAFTFDTR
jgi:hypothetical protein